MVVGGHGRVGRTVCPNVVWENSEDGVYVTVHCHSLEVCLVKDTLRRLYHVTQEYHVLSMVTGLHGLNLASARCPVKWDFKLDVVYVVIRHLSSGDCRVMVR